MKLCISSTGDNLSAQVDPRFGRSAYFIFYDTDKDSFESVQNPNVMAPSGAGIQSAQLAINKGVEAVITGNVGPNAFGIFNSAGINVITGVAGITVKEAIEKFKKGEFKKTASNPTVPGHFGIGGAFAMPPGAGGRGRGFMGPGGFISPGFGQGVPFPQPQMNKEHQLQLLKQQVEFLKQQMDAINERIKELENED